MMFLRNKFLLFLLTCTIANPCFGDCAELFCPNDSGQIVLNQIQWNAFSNNINNLYNYINTSATAFDELLNNTTDPTKPSIKSRIEDLYNSKTELDALINGSGSNSLASLLSGSGANSLKNLLYGENSLKSKIENLQQEIGNLSTSKENMDKLINGSDSTSLAKRIEFLGTEVGNFSQNLETLEGLIGTGGSFGVISQGLTDTTQQLSGAIHDLQNIQFRPIVLRLGCAEGYYVAKCGDINLDLNTILGYVNEYYNIDSSCWNQDKPYEEMRYLLHLKGVTGTTVDGTDITDDNATYTSEGSAFRDHFKQSACGYITDNESGLYKLQELRKNVFDTCISSSYVCLKCPDDGQTGDVKTELILAQSAIYNQETGVLEQEAIPAHWKSFNTIADCFTQSGSDAKGTFTVEGNAAPDDKCYYDY